MYLADRQYSRDPYEGSGWWASINVVLAVGHRLRVVNKLVPQEEDKKAWLYLKNSMAVLAELTMRNTDLLSVQALLGMVSFFFFFFFFFWALISWAYSTNEWHFV